MTRAVPGQKPTLSAPGNAALLKNLLFSGIAFLIVLIALHVIAYFGIRYQNDRQVRRTGEALKNAAPLFVEYANLRMEFIHPFLKMTLAPNQNLPFCRINRQGHRGPDFVRKKTGAFRIAIIGGSAALGWCASSETETIHSLLQTALEKPFPDRRFEVYNFAMSQYNSTQELFVLETEVLAYQPDFVIILSGINDFGWASGDDQWQPYYPLGWPHMSTIIRPAFFQDSWPRRPWFLRSSFKWSFLARTAWENLKIRCSPVVFFHNIFARPRTNHNFAFDDTDYALIGKRTELWARNIEMMARLLDSFGIPYCASLQPCEFYHRRPTGIELQVVDFFIRGRSDKRNALRYWNTVYPEAEKALVSRSYPVRTLDLTRCFEDVQDIVYFDVCHFNARGAEILARRYAERIRPYVETWAQKK